RLPSPVVPRPGAGRVAGVAPALDQRPEVRRLPRADAAVAGRAPAAAPVPPPRRPPGALNPAAQVASHPFAKSLHLSRKNCKSPALLPGTSRPRRSPASIDGVVT